MWTLQTVSSGNSLRSNESIVDYFKNIFPDSKFAMNIFSLVHILDRKRSFRWAENSKVAAHIIDTLPSIINIINFWQKLSKSKQSNTKVARLFVTLLMISLHVPSFASLTLLPKYWSNT